MDLVREMIELVRDEVTAPGIDQSRGNWEPHGSCCMGSRIGHALGMDPGFSYLEAVDEWARRMELNRVRVIAMLQEAGAGHDPLGPARWPETPAAVWRRLAELGESPGLAGRDLSRLNLSRCDLRGENLRTVSLRRCNLRGTLLDNADLGFSLMQMADLRGASVRSANLAGADLFRADLTGADLAKSNLRGARLDGASIALARMEQTRMARQLVTGRGTNWK